MVSCDRQPNYAQHSVRHFRAGSDMPLVVFVDGDDDAYLGKHENVTTIVEPVTKGTDVSSWRAYDRCRVNTIRAVQSVPKGADLLLLEDDIALRRDWGVMLSAALAQCHGRFGRDFVLSLYSATKPGRKEGLLAGYHYRDYYGNIAVVLSSGAVEKFLEVAKHTNVPSDMIVKEMLWRTRIPLRQTKPNMAQHLGDVSTTGLHRVIRSASFRGGFAGGPNGAAAKRRPKRKPGPKLARKPKLSSRTKPRAMPESPSEPKPKPPPKPRYKDKVHICLATLPDRESSLEKTINSLRGQADTINIYLNGHQRVPAFLRGERGSDCTIWRSKENGGAVMKFWWSDKLEGYLLTCDDDIIYPPNYVERVVDAIERYERRAVVGLHGVTIPPGFQRYVRDREVVAYNEGLVADKPVHILGTGGMAYHSSTLRVSTADFPYPNMTDIWFGIACQKRRVPIVCIARPLGWLEVMPQLTGIWDSVVQDDTKQSESALTIDEWKLHEVNDGRVDE